MRNTFVGLAGGWGTALMGRHDTPMKISTGKLDLFADTMADYNGTVGFRDLRADNAVAYISPSFAGFTFAGAIIPAGGATGGYNSNAQANGLNLNEERAGRCLLPGRYLQQRALLRVDRLRVPGQRALQHPGRQREPEQLPV